MADAEARVARLGKLLGSVQALRTQALAQGDPATTARAEELIIRFEQRIAQLEAEAAQRGRRHVLVVDRAPEVLRTAGALLQGERYTVTTSPAGPRTFALIAALAPDLLLVDLSVGAGAGWALLERLHAAAATQRLPVIVTAADPALLARAARARAGGARFLLTPLDPDALRAAVAQLLGPA